MNWRLQTANLNSFSLCWLCLLQQHNKSYYGYKRNCCLSPRGDVCVRARHLMLKYVLRIDVLKPELYNSSKLKWPYHFNGFKINAYTYENFHVWWAQWFTLSPSLFFLPFLAISEKLFSCIQSIPFLFWFQAMFQLMFWYLSQLSARS